MSDFISRALQFVFSFAIIVMIHELGHFLAARLFGCRVEKFYMFFNPWFSLFKKKIGDTEYGIGWVPFGGYVKIAGMVDESMDKDQLRKAPESWELRSKKPWQKIIVMAAGVLFNLVLAIVIFIGISYCYGDKYIANKDLKYGLHFSELGQSLGLRDGDVVTEVNGVAVDDFTKIPQRILLEEAKFLTVLRDGHRLTLPVPEGFIHQMAQQSRDKTQKEPFATPLFGAYVGEVLAEARFTRQALLSGDKIIQIDAQPIRYFLEVMAYIREKKNQEIALRVLRGADSLTVTAQVNAAGRIGFTLAPEQDITYTEIKYGLLASVPQGFQMAFKVLSDYLGGLKLLFVSKEVKVNDSLGSVISIGRIFPVYFDWRIFWTLTALFSVMIGVMNLLPIPALDGGHIVFAAYEWIMRKPAPQKVMEYAQMAGMVLLFGFMIYALGLDVTRLFH